LDGLHHRLAILLAFSFSTSLVSISVVAFSFSVAFSTFSISISTIAIAIAVQAGSAVISAKLSSSLVSVRRLRELVVLAWRG